MTTAKLIGKETAKARLVVWHRARIARGFPLLNKIGQEEKLHMVTSGFYASSNTRKICQEYDEVFSAVDSKWTADDQSTMSELNALTQQA